jgi:polysaccharide export outer membrane protein
VAAAELTGIDVVGGVDQAGTHLVLTFAADVPDLEVRRGLSGVEVWLPDTRAAVDGSDRVSVTRLPEGVELRITAPGSTVDSFHLNGATLTLRFSAARGNADAGYRLGVGDVVTVSVYRDKDLSGSFPILPDGTILMPLIGAVPAAGRSQSELVATLRDRLGEFLVSPQLSISVTDYNSQYVVVTQIGGKTERIALRPGMTLRGVLSEAGAAPIGTQTVTLTRAGRAGDTRTLTAEQLGSPDAPAPRDGDVLTLDEPEYVFVSGEVRRPGKFVYSDGMTLQHALTLAEGLTEWASKKEIHIQRHLSEHAVDEIVNLKRVISRKIPDPELRPGDLVVVRRRLL